MSLNITYNTFVGGIKMSVGGWYAEKNEAQKEYDAGRITREVYELRTKFAIGMIYEYGDEEVAKRMAKAHGYNINELIELVSRME